MKHSAIEWLTGLIAVGACVLGTPALAADCEHPRKAGTLTEAIYHGVEESAKLMSDKKFDEAIGRLKDIVDSGEGSDYEKALVNLNLGFAYSSKNDYAGAADAFGKAVTLKALPQKQHEQLQYNLGQIYVAAGKLEPGITALQAYIAEACEPVPPEAHLFLANALSEAGHPRQALPQIDLAISKSKQPKEPWVQLKLAIQYELKDYPACARTLVMLIGMSPEKTEYWKQLSSLYYEMERNLDSVAVLALAERGELLQKPSEIDNLYNVYMGLNLPYKAGRLVAEAMKSGRVPEDEKHIEMAANAWINASETQQAEATLQRLAAMSDRGEYYFRLGAMYGEQQRWKESVDMLDKALNKGGLKQAGEAWMRLAVARYSLKDTDGARAALQKAAGYERTRKQAEQWLQHLRTAQGVADQNTST
ncbi:MAG: tetratricopeptide repeat protein [Gammaproteobacteria bacterium]|nr:tetratricopeptide repeat protein [Gammaproteobacteria bacterium]